jgi:hypothetical protein
MEHSEDFSLHEPARDTGEMINATLELPEPRQETLPDGSEAVVSGDPEGWASVLHRQGESDPGYFNTCGIVGCEQILRRFGVEVTEAQLLDHALAENHCDVLGPGYVSLEDQVDILRDYGVPAHTDHNGTLDALADDIEHGRAVALAVNSEALYGYEGWNGTDHVILATGVARDVHSGEIKGFTYNDSATGQPAYAVADRLQAAWADQGGNSLITEGTDTRDTARTLGSSIWTSTQGWVYV